jgi:hypothetical protein
MKEVAQHDNGHQSIICGSGIQTLCQENPTYILGALRNIHSFNGI